MSNPIINNLRRQIEGSKPKPGSMVAGLPKANVNICDLEGLIARYEAMSKRAISEQEIKDAEIDFLVGVISDLLLAADATWEQRNEGHDWAEACRIARVAIGTPGMVISPEWLKKKIESDPDDVEVEAGIPLEDRGQ